MPCGEGATSQKPFSILSRTPDWRPNPIRARIGAGEDREKPLGASRHRGSVSYRRRRAILLPPINGPARQRLRLGGLKVARNVLPWRLSLFGSRKRHRPKRQSPAVHLGHLLFGSRLLHQSIVQTRGTAIFRRRAAVRGILCVEMPVELRLSAVCHRPSAPDVLAVNPE
jgi:hypothetical protein